MGFGGGLKAAMLMSSSLSHVRPITCASSSRLVSHPHDLVKWVTREGGFVHRAVKIAQLDSGGLGLGLVAKEEIPIGSELIVLPQHLPLHFTSFHQDSNDDENSLLLQLSSHVPDELWAMKLGLKLLRERAKLGSFWWPYISNLPETYTLPIFFPGEDIKNLQYAPVLHQVLSSVSSRAFKLHGNKNANGMNFDIPMMLPLIDMCNHSFDPNARIVQEQETGSTNMRVVAEKVIKEDDPLLLCYGCLNNDLFLLDYGFVIQSNPYDCIELRYDGALLEAASTAAGVSSPNFSTPAPWQELILSQLNLSGEAPDLKVSLGGEEIIEGRLLAALRVLLASDKETVQKYDLSTLQSLDAEAPLGVANDIAVFRTLIALCVVALGHFPTKLMDDESLLKQGASGSTELAIQFRIQKKSIIIDVMKNLARKVKLLSSNETVTAEG
ncbi:hypothetical protein RYX36_033183 [Vicia faba]